MLVKQIQIVLSQTNTVPNSCGMVPKMENHMDMELIATLGVKKFVQLKNPSLCLIGIICKLTNSVTILSIGARIQMSLLNPTGKLPSQSMMLQKNVLIVPHVEEKLWYVCSTCGHTMGNMNQPKVVGIAWYAQNQPGKCLMEEKFNGFVMRSK